MKVPCMLVADPVGPVAERTVNRFRRIADEGIAVSTGEQVLTALKRHKPQLMLLSLELREPNVIEVVRAVRKKLPRTVIIGTFRELSVPVIERLNREGIEEFVAHPVRRSEVFSVVSRRLGIQTRLHPRFEAAVEVHRADGVFVGKTRNISSEGMLIHTAGPASVNQSLMVYLSLSPTERIRVRCRVLELEHSSPGTTLARAMFERVRGREHESLTNFIDQLETAGRELS